MAMKRLSLFFVVLFSFDGLLADSATAFKELERETSGCEKALKSTTAKVKELQQENAAIPSLKASIDELQSANSAIPGLQEKISLLDSQMTELHTAAKSRISALEEENAQLQSSNESLTASEVEQSQRQQALEELKTENEALAREIIALKEENSKLVAQIATAATVAIAPVQKVAPISAPEPSPSPESSEPEYIVGTVAISVDACHLHITDLICKLKLTAVSGDPSLYIYFPYVTAFGDKGEKLGLKQLSLANLTRKSGLEGTLIEGVETSMVLTFENAPREMVRVSKLQMSLKIDGTWQEASFRAINL